MHFGAFCVITSALIAALQCAASGRMPTTALQHDGATGATHARLHLRQPVSELSVEMVHQAHKLLKLFPAAQKASRGKFDTATRMGRRLDKISEAKKDLVKKAEDAAGIKDVIKNPSLPRGRLVSKEDFPVLGRKGLAKHLRDEHEQLFLMKKEHKGRLYAIMRRKLLDIHGGLWKTEVDKITENQQDAEGTLMAAELAATIHQMLLPSEPSLTVSLNTVSRYRDLRPFVKGWLETSSIFPSQGAAVVPPTTHTQPPPPTAMKFAISALLSGFRESCNRNDMLVEGSTFYTDLATSLYLATMVPRDSLHQTKIPIICPRDVWKAFVQEKGTAGKGGLQDFTSHHMDFVAWLLGGKEKNETIEHWADGLEDDLASGMGHPLTDEDLQKLENLEEPE
ncbi:unnamed protein product [Vitrella brassicaformis CCMP3155]|uniref:Uncharacterized protein n=1 Tax=Vitrella brassicaformis (strain CCMP3155) TaxID=1169540 RepID=A0A0G4ECM5_VITBC|nr:unnamed protein product [Vitrella brassicaformis CCMP3155]|mmetsp:Transcript_44734/g.111237  ORF Transcript_44734/g.111237 Transcript_44734/m.111237 type:complete len:395 (-) Transcript_44734:246-1430(-)|eukprot:CEL93056.1 unnamed protein product [Vitrella brassicaformis CCMP3155]